MAKPTHIIIYSHGFGVRSDDRGLFATVGNSIYGTINILFHYNDFDDKANTMTIAPFDQSVDSLSAVIAGARRGFPDATIDIVAHSMGCLMVALANTADANIRKVVFLAPPRVLEDLRDKVIDDQRPGSHYTDDGTLYYSRNDGSTTIIPGSVWLSFEQAAQQDFPKLFNSLAAHTSLTIFQALDDEYFGAIDWSDVSDNVKVINVQADHNFSGHAREQMVDLIKAELL